MTFAFLSGNLGLDLAGTLKWRDTEPEELLADPADLDRWLVEAGVVDVAPGCGPDDLADAREVREAVYALVLQDVAGAPYDEGAARRLGEAAARPMVSLELGPDGLTRSGDPGAALAVVARAALELLGERPRPLVKQCGRAACTRVYLDRSRGGRRTWCGMAECGDRVKAASYRRRKRGEAAQA